MVTSNNFTGKMWQLTAATFMHVLLVKKHSISTHAKNSVRVVRGVQWTSKFKPIFLTIFFQLG